MYKRQAQIIQLAEYVDDLAPLHGIDHELAILNQLLLSHLFVTRDILVEVAVVVVDLDGLDIACLLYTSRCV